MGGKWPKMIQDTKRKQTAISSQAMERLRSLSANAIQVRSRSFPSMMRKSRIFDLGTACEGVVLKRYAGRSQRGSHCFFHKAGHSCQRDAQKAWATGGWGDWS